MKVEELKKGDFFTKKPVKPLTNPRVWIRGDYDRSQHRYECQSFDDASEFCYLPGDKDVSVDFTF